VLLLHGFTLSHHVWHGVVDDLSSNYDVLAMTMPGHWRGPRLRVRDLGVRGIADGIERELDDLGWDTCHVAGNSLGGQVGFELERRGRARSLVAINPSGGWKRFSVTEFRLGMGFAAQFPLAAVARVFGDRVATRERFQRPIIRNCSKDTAAVTPEDAANVLRAVSHCPIYLPIQLAFLRDGPLAHLDRVTAPTTLIMSEFDTFLTVYGPDGSLLDWVDDNPYSIDAELTLELPETGRYLVVVSGYSSHDLGRYTVSMTTHDPAVTPSATEIDVPGVFAGVLDGDGPMVPYMEVPGGAHVFELTEPAALAIYAASDAFDTYVLVTDAEGSLVVENDDRNYSEASGYDTSSLAFAEFEPGVYYVYVTSWYSQPIGEYDLEIRRFVYAD